MAKFFTADTHFGFVDYEGIVRRDFRPFKTTNDMNKFIIKLWNTQAGKDDIIYHVGDFVNYNCKDKDSYEICFDFVKKLKAKVVLILGNNEKRLLKQKFDDDFEKFREYLLNKGFYDVVKDGLELDACGTKLYLTHMPVDHKDGFINLFGHIHGCCFVKQYGFNVGVDNHYLSMFTEDEISRLIGSLPLYDENVFE